MLPAIVAAYLPYVAVITAIVTFICLYKAVRWICGLLFLLPSVIALLRLIHELHFTAEPDIMNKALS